MEYNERADKMLKYYATNLNQKYIDLLLKDFSLREINENEFVYDNNFNDQTQIKTVYYYDDEINMYNSYDITFKEHFENVLLGENQQSKVAINVFYESLSANEAEIANLFYNYTFNRIKEIKKSIPNEILTTYPFINDCLNGIKTRAKNLHQKKFGTIKIDNARNSLYIQYKYFKKVESLSQILDSDAFKEFYIELGGNRKAGGYINCDTIARFKKIFKDERISYPIIWNKSINSLTLLIEKLISAKIINTDYFSRNNQGLWQTVAKCFFDKNGKKIALTQFNTRNSNDATLTEIIDEFIINLNQEFKD